jgi:hypothetical protein
MWFQRKDEKDATGDAVVPLVPLRKASVRVADLAIGKTLRFAGTCPLPPLAGAFATVIAIRSYRFGEDVTRSFQLRVGEATHYYLTVAEDMQGNYLALSRQLSRSEQDSWFGHDALSFFTEESSAKSIRCKADLMEEGEWAAARYAKTVDWVEGSLSLQESGRLSHALHYSLLVNDAGDKALEVEHDDVSGDNRFLITVYRPIEDIAAVDVREPMPIAANDDSPPTASAPKPAPTPAMSAPAAEPPLFAPQPKQRLDFRRLDDAAPIHIARTPPTALVAEEAGIDLPSFLVPKEGNYLGLDQVIPPEPERVRVGLSAARNLIDLAEGKNARVRDVLREMLGLESALSEEVIFELPLTDADYRLLAMRYKLRPDHRVEIRARLEEELRAKLQIAKRP